MNKIHSIIFLSLFSCSLLAQQGPEATSPLLLPDHITPQLGSWFWRGDELVEDGYKKYIDRVSEHAAFKILTTTFRFPDLELTDKRLHRQVELATEYARQKGIGIAPDLDVRLARRSFLSRYPDEMQEMLILKEIQLERKKESKVVILSKDLTDHYTGRAEHYVALKGELKRVYAYQKDEEGIKGSSLEDITENCCITHCSKDSIIISLPKGKKLKAGNACVMVTFTHLAADVFAPHLKSFQRELVQSYSDIALAGVNKDEWGFPPCFDETYSEFWYSDHRAKAYAERTEGRELLEDCLLMSLGIKGKERERIMAINHFRDMSYRRNSDLEDDYYRSVKEFIGPHAIVTTHPTWYPYPGFREFKKNGLDWWAATRDWAQTDEVTPFGVRTALSKKWGSTVWYNMYYYHDISGYNSSVWSHALGGGRINYHPIYPSDDYISDQRDVELLKGDLMKAECRIRLLNFISEEPLDCPVAVVFGHAGAMNWAGPNYDDVGMALVDSLWASGIPSDLIPSSEIQHLDVNEDGWITYGPQKYSALILYHPEYENPEVAGFFRSAAGGKTRMMRMGNWTRDFNGKTFDGNSALPESMSVYADLETVLRDIKDVILEKGIPLQSQAEQQMTRFGHVLYAPPTAGHCRLIDGTMIQVAGSKQVSGDPIVGLIGAKAEKVLYDAIGLAAYRMDAKGKICALAAGGLKSFRGGDLEIELDQRIDLALWKNQVGEWEGVLQGWEKEIPSALLHVTKKWSRLSLPVEYADTE